MNMKSDDRREPGLTPAYTRGALAAGCLTLVLALGGCEGVGPATEATYLERAEQHLAESSYPAAIIEYRNALRLNPSPETRARLGLAYARDGQTDLAATHLLRAVTEGADPESYALILAEQLFQLERHADLIGIPRPTQLSARDDARFLAYQAIAHYRTGNPEQGLERLEQALARDNTLAEVHLAQAYRAMHQGDGETATTALQAALSANDRFAAAWALSGELARWQNDPETAIAAFARAIELRPQSLSERMQRGMILIELQRYEEAQRDADFLRSRASDHPAGHFLRGLIHFERNEIREAQGHFEQAIAVYRDYRPAMPYLAAIQIEQGNLAQARRFLERDQALGEPTAMAYQLWARLHIAQNRPEEARRVLRRAIETRPDLAAALGNQLASLYMQAGDMDAGINVLRAALTDQPDAHGLREMLGVALLRGGQQEQGLSLLQELTATLPEARIADVVIVVEHLRNQDYQRALEAATRLREKNPGISEGYNLMAAALLGLERQDQARAIFREGLEALPDNAELAMNLSALELQQGQRQAAIDLLESVQQSDPGHPGSALRLAALAAGDERFDDAMRWLEQATRNYPEATDPYLGLVLLHLEAGRMASAENTLVRALEHHPDDPRFLLALADVQERQGQHDAAIASLGELSGLESEAAAEVQFRLARNLTAVGRNDDARDALREALNLHPDHLAARIVLVRILSRGGEVAEAERLFRPLTEVANPPPDVPAQQAWFDARQGRLEQAVRGYDQALEREMNRRWLGERHEILVQLGRTDEAASALRGWLQQHPDDQGIRHVLGSTLLNAAHNQEAVAVYRELIAQQPDDAAALNNLAWLLHRENTAEALRHAQRAVELQPEHPSILDTLGVVLLEDGQPEQAVRILRKAHEGAPDMPEIGLHLAQGLIAQGNLTEARDLLRRLLERHPDFPERAQAQALLADIE